MAPSSVIDETALGELYARLERPMYNVVYRRLWNEQDSVDVVQEAFVRLWKARARVRSDGAEAYAWRTVLNLASNRRRSRRLWGWLAFDADRDGGAAGGPDEGLERRQREAAVRAAIDALPDKLRDVVLLAEFSELGNVEIAAILHIPPGTVGSRRHLAAARLRELLGGA
ncbi:MAG: sigma-70 family RNA polymerase sigma factor [Deltaproteobacteria bacterium]|nr:sigma-70 family RNA polymerase sigma factor [Deltaproteobacteria bacterium]